MGLDEFLSGLRPELNDGFDILEGVYRCVIKHEEKAETGWVSGVFKDGTAYERMQITADVTDVLAGNGGPGRRFWLRYNVDEEGLKRLINDLFTASLLDSVDRTSVESLKDTLPTLQGKMLYIRGWSWSPEKDRQGNVIPEEQRVARQSQSVKSEKSLKKLLAQAAATPF